MEKISIVIPAYNEELAIREELEKIKEVMEKTTYEYEIIVVDDGSEDKTAEMVRSIEGVKLLQHKTNQGVGAARKNGIIQTKGEFIVMIDGDGTYPCEDIPKLLEYMPEYDMVVGARKQEAGTMQLLRRPAKWFLLKLASYIVGYKIPDLNSGLRAFKKNAALRFFGILPNGHSWVSTITLAFLSNGYSVKYIPIDYYKRKGKSTFHPLKDTYNYFLLINRTIMYFRPLRFFAPLTLIMLSGGIVRFLYHAIVTRDVRESDIMIILSAIILGTIGVLADLILKLHRFHFTKVDPEDRNAKQ